MSRMIQRLMTAGILNHDSEDFGKLGDRPKKTEAYCTSFTCTGDPHGKEKESKSVPRGISQCPDCGSYLFFGTKRGSH